MVKDLRVASPCPADWNRMLGDDRVRHCAECNLNVYNFSAMTTAEVEELISNHQGRLCGRLYQRRDGTILTKDCPVGFQIKIRRISRVAGTALTAIMGVAGAAAQIVTPTKAPVATEIQQKNSEIRFNVADRAGAVISDAYVRMLDKSGSESVAGTTDKGGNFTARIKPGIYTLSIERAGFIDPKQIVEIKHDETMEVQLTLEVATMGVIVEAYDLHIEPEALDVPLEKIEAPAPTSAISNHKKDRF